MPIRLFFITILFLSYPCLAVSQSYSQPDEYAANGALGTAMQNGASTQLTGFEAIRVNPAMLTLERKYEVTGVYHWPRFEKEFFQAGIVDSKTSKIAAGVSVTRRIDKVTLEKNELNPLSPVKQRVHFGFGQPVGKLAVGFGGQYVEGYALDSGDDSEPKMIRGTTLTAGVAALLSPSIRVGFSGQNFTNKQVSHLAPRVLQAGASLLLGGGNLALNADYIQRRRISGLEVNGSSQYRVFALKAAPSITEQELPTGDTRTVVGSFTAQVYNAFQIMGAYGSDVTIGQKSISGGVSVVSGAMRLVFSATRPDMEIETAHQSVSINIDLNI